MKKIAKSYKKFWAVLGSSSLYLYKNSKDTNEVESIPLTNIHISSDDTTKAPFSFEITLSDGTIQYFAVNTQNERNEWIEMLLQLSDSPFSDNEDEDPDMPRSTFAFKREKLLLSYRYMKNMVEQQATPRIIYLPQGEVMHRFGYEIAIRKLVKAFGSLDTLYFKDCQFGGDCIDDLIRFLEYFDHITSIVFENTSKSANCDPFTIAVSRLPLSIDSLTFVSSLSSKGIQMICNDIPQCHSLVKLVLQNVPIKNEIIPFIQAINSSSIERLEISNSDLGDTGSSTAFALLTVNTTLRHLTLHQVGATRNCKDSLTTYILNDALISLDLSGNKLGDSVEALFSVLAENQLQMKYLNLSDTRMTHSEVFGLCKMLQENKTIYSLDVSENRLKEDSAKVICVALANNTSLCELFIRNAFKNIRHEEQTSIQKRLQANMQIAKNQPILQTEKRRSPLTILKTNDKTLVTLSNFIRFDIIKNRKSLETNEIFLNLRKLILDTLESSMAPDESSSEFLEQQDIRYTIGSNRNLLFEILKFLCIARLLKNRSRSVRDSTIVSKASFMHKRGGKMKSWKRRWFCLSNQCIFYYVNKTKQNHKGTIVLEDSRVELSSHGMTEFSFTIFTPNRDYLLSCDTNEDRESWIEHIKAAQVKIGSDNNPLARLKTQIQSFCNVVQFAKIGPHTLWILQWWFPLCIETLCRFYLRRQQDTFDDLDDFLVAQSEIAMYLLTGDYLYDRKLARGFESLVRVAHDVPDVKQFQIERISVMRQVIADIEYESVSIQDILHLWELNMKEDPIANISQEFIHNSRLMDSLRINNTLLELEDFQGVLFPMFEIIPENLLSELLFITKDDATDDDGKVENPAPVVPFISFSYISQEGSFRNLLFPPQKSFTNSVETPLQCLHYLLQEVPLVSALYEGTYRFTSFVKWFRQEWPQSQNKRATEISSSENLFALRMVFVLGDLFVELKNVPISVDNMKLYNKWTECRSTIDETIYHLGSCAIHGFDREDPVVQTAFDFILIACTTTLTDIVHSLLVCDNRLGEENIQHFDLANK